jgi:hypothetical protein
MNKQGEYKRCDAAMTELLNVTHEKMKGNAEKLRRNGGKRLFKAAPKTKMK